MRKRNYAIAGILATALMPMNVMASSSFHLDVEDILKNSNKEKIVGEVIEFGDRIQPLRFEKQKMVQKIDTKLSSTYTEEFGNLYTNVGRPVKLEDSIRNKPAGESGSKEIGTLKDYENKPLELVRKYTSSIGQDSYLFKSGGSLVGWVSGDSIVIGENDIAYILKEGETLQDVADKYDKTPEYIRLMNSLGDQEEPPAGTKLKLVLGISESNNVGNVGDLTKTTKPAQSVQDFINRISEDTIEIGKKHQVLPSVIMAQAILESRNGTSGLATVGNNLFGIKGTYKGQNIILPTLEEYNGVMYRVHAPFRKYPSWAESIEDHSNLLTSNPRYARVVGQEDYSLVTSGLQEAGYATDSNYASKLNQLISIYDLTRFDPK